jgi:hypothetical protein
MIDAFLAGPFDDSDFAVAVAPAEIVIGAYPGSVRTFIALVAGALRLQPVSRAQ